MLLSLEACMIKANKCQCETPNTKYLRLPNMSPRDLGLEKILLT